MSTVVNPAISEAGWMTRVLDLLRLHRWRFVHFQPAITARGSWRTPFDGNPGFPDLICVKGGAWSLQNSKQRGAFLHPISVPG
jgi:hypothetical protein